MDKAKRDLEWKEYQLKTAEHMYDIALASRDPVTALAALQLVELIEKRNKPTFG